MIQTLFWISWKRVSKQRPLWRAFRLNLEGKKKIKLVIDSIVVTISQVPGWVIWKNAYQPSNPCNIFRLFFVRKQTQLMKIVNLRNSCERISDKGLTALKEGLHTITSLKHLSFNFGR